MLDWFRRWHFLAIGQARLGLENHMPGKCAPNVCEKMGGRSKFAWQHETSYAINIFLQKKHIIKFILCVLKYLEYTKSLKENQRLECLRMAGSYDSLQVSTQCLVHKP